MKNMPLHSQGGERNESPDNTPISYCSSRLLLSATVAAQQQALPDPSLVDMPDEPGLPRVLLIGDSISMDYTVPVRRLLQGRANVHRIPMNGSTTLTGLQNLSSWLGDKKWDVIHFNWGLHDLTVMPDGSFQVDLESYERNLRVLVTQLKRTGAALIWATTTPVPDASVEHLLRRQQDVVPYNTVARKVMDENKIAIDDLYTFALPQLTETQKPANVHFTDYGSELLARCVAKSILSALKRREKSKIKNNTP